jgi:hypothetical protein
MSLPRFQIQNLQIPNPSTGQMMTIMVPVVNQGSDVPSYSRSPEWMIKIGDKSPKGSNVTGKETYVEVFGWSGAVSRSSSPNLGGQHHSTATLIHTDLVVIIPMGGYVAQITNAMANGEVIPQIDLERLANIEKVLQVVQTIVFKVCRIQSVKQQIEQAVITIQIQQRTDTIKVYGQDGKAAGQVVSDIDFSKIVVK